MIDAPEAHMSRGEWATCHRPPCRRNDLKQRLSVGRLEIALMAKIFALQATSPASRQPGEGNFALAGSAQRVAVRK
jgi:hypothetical protein